MNMMIKILCVGLHYRAAACAKPAHVPRLARGRGEDESTVTVQQVVIDVEVKVDRAVQRISAAAADGSVCVGWKVTMTVVLLRHIIAECASQYVGQHGRVDGEKAVYVVSACIVFCVFVDVTVGSYGV